MEPMKPMKAMEPMQPMRPMEPMKAMAPAQRWWSENLGEPTTSGAQNGMRYAFFPQKKRLLIDQDGKVTTYESGDHQINGVAQQQSGSQTLTFTSQDGHVNLGDLKRL